MTAAILVAMPGLRAKIAIAVMAATAICDMQVEEGVAMI
jgi:hypothetical protein